MIRITNSSGIISTFAGNGTFGYGGDGGQATAAELANPAVIAFDAYGNLYISDEDNDCIRQVNTSGIITTIAGYYHAAGFSGDGGQATAAALYRPNGITFDAVGNLYFADMLNMRIRKINTSGIISTIAGNGTAGYSGDGSQATSAELNFPMSVVLDSYNNLYIADYSNSVIRKVDTLGIITTVVGNGTAGYGGDNGQATTAKLGFPSGIILDTFGNLYIADNGYNIIRKVSTSGIITTIAGTAIQGFSGDGGQATAAELNQPYSIALDALGNLLISDTVNNRIRRVCYNSSSCSTASIEQFTNNKEQVNIYPNPSNGNINLTGTSNIDEIKVSDTLGQTVYKTKPNAANTTITLNNTGVYFVTLTSGTETTTKKVIVNK